MRYVFPAVLTWDDSDKVYLVYFPDTEGYFGCYTDGYDLYEALDYAEDVLGLMLWSAEKDGDPIPKPSDIKDIKAPEGAIVTLIRADTEAYAKMMAERKAAKDKIAGAAVEAGAEVALLEKTA